MDWTVVLVAVTVMIPPTVAAILAYRASILAYRAADLAHKRGRENTQAIEQNIEETAKVHTIVNSQKTEMLREIQWLKAHLAIAQGREPPAEGEGDVR